MEKPTFKKICFMYLQQLTNFPYIEKDFDAISDYQLLCKVVDYLNEVISNNNKQNEVITSLYNAFVELKDYVDNYFKNLDVQEEIDNKLDKMAASGELADIIAQYLRVASVLGYDTKASLKSADNLVNGSITRTLGESTYNDGKGSYYKIRTITSSDVIDDNNILALANFPTLIAEKLPDYRMNQVEEEIKPLKIKEEYFFHTLMATEFYRRNDPLVGMQGGCVLPNGKILQCTGANDSVTGKIIVYNTDGTIYNSATVNYGHCGAVCYNSKTETVFITGDTDNVSPYSIYEINPSNLVLLHTYDVSGKSFPDIPYGIIYDETNEKYIFCNPWNDGIQDNYIWTTDEEFNIIDSESYDFNVRSSSGMGKFGEYIGINVLPTNKVLLFDYDLNYVKEVYLNQLVSDSWCMVEPEWFTTINNIIYLGFNPISSTSPSYGGGVKCYATCDINNNYQETINNHDQFIPFKETYYIDPTANYNPLRNGSKSAPFNNIMEALNASLRENNNNGDVEIHFLHDEENTYRPLFTMNKNYRIYSYNNTPIHALSNIFVNNSAKVYFSPAIVLTGNAIDIENPIGSGNANISVRGSLIFESNVNLANTSTKVTISGPSTCYIRLPICNAGLDLTNFYGELENSNNTLFASNDILTLGTFYSWSRKIKNVKCTVSETSTNVFPIPKLSPSMLITVRTRLPYGANSENEELTFPIVYDNYSRELIHFKTSDNVDRIISLTYTAGTLTIEGYTSALSNLRVKYYSI